MDIKTARKKTIKGQAILDLKKQVDDALNIINSAVLNIESAINEMKKDPVFDIQEMQEFKNVLAYAINETLKDYNKWSDKYSEIVIA
jgi:soluble cytochrome b562